MTSPSLYRIVGGSSQPIVARPGRFRRRSNFGSYGRVEETYESVGALAGPT